MHSATWRLSYKFSYNWCNYPQYSPILYTCSRPLSCQWFPDITMFELNFCYFHYLSLIKVNSRCAHLPSPWGNRGVFSHTSHSGCLRHYSSALHLIDQSTSARGSREKNPEALYLFPRASYWGLLFLAEFSYIELGLVPWGIDHLYFFTWWKYCKFRFAYVQLGLACKY